MSAQTINKPQLQRMRCKWCGEIEVIPGRFDCGTTTAGERGRKCYVACGEQVPAHIRPRSRKKPPSEWGVSGRQKSPERLEVETMQLGQTRYFALDREKLVRFCQCLVSRRNDGTQLKVRNDKTRLIVNMVSRVDDLEIGESRKYSNDFSLVAWFIANRNLKFLRGQESRMLTFDLIDGVYWLRRLA